MSILQEMTALLAVKLLLATGSPEQRAKVALHFANRGVSLSSAREAVKERR